MKGRINFHLSLLALLLLFACGNEPFIVAPTGAAENWSAYLGDAQTSQYSQLQQITPENVGQLREAWRYESGVPDSLNRGQIQCNPLIVDGVLYGTSPELVCFALRADSGRELWRFEPAEFSAELFGMGVNRGLTYWTDGAEDHRIYYAVGRYLIGLNAKTGKALANFGQDGRVDLRSRSGDGQEPWPYVVATSPGVIYEDKIIIGSRVSESAGAAPGNIRAFDIHDGSLAWSFNTIPAPGSFGADSWQTGGYGQHGGANAWAGLSLDRQRGWVFAPTGSAAYDFYGGDRLGDNLFANCILALDARSGERIWHYQTVHHDLWDRDLPATPVLVTVEHEGKPTDAVAQTTKGGYLFLLDRETGEPLFPVEERSFPTSDLTGEVASPTQPIPVKPPPFTRQHYGEAEVYDLDSAGAAKSRALLVDHYAGGPFIPPSVEGTVLFPGFDGGAEWGGAAFDPASATLFVNASEAPWLIKMNPMGELAQRPVGERLYRTRCQGCHGERMEGGGVFESPALVGLENRLDRPAIAGVIRQGRGVMPAFDFLEETDVEAVTDFILGQKESTGEENSSNDWPLPYRMNGYQRLSTDDGYPLVKPPWGTISAIDLNEGTIRWQVPLGAYPELVKRGLTDTGSENYGGPVVTAGGLLFIAATPDRKFRALDVNTGATLWETELPAAGYATPATYAVDGRQYVVIACGGGKIGSASGASYVAFSLDQLDVTEAAND